MTLTELKALCVDRFPTSTTRAAIMEGLERVLAQLTQTGLQAEAWIDGSFLTEKIDPEDSDIVVRVTPDDIGQITPEQALAIEWLHGDLRQDHRCDSYFFVELHEWLRAYWIRQFGFSRDNVLKGIAVVNLPITP